VTARPLLAILDGIGGPELLLVFVVVLIFFGGEKMPEFARGLGKILREFKKATSEVEHEIKRAMAEPEATLRPYVPPAATTGALAASASPVAPPATGSDLPQLNESTPGAPSALGQPAESAHPGENPHFSGPAPAAGAFDSPSAAVPAASPAPSLAPSHEAPPSPTPPLSAPPSSSPSSSPLPRAPEFHRPGTDDHGIDA
jgi:sec-independent protein translocase protein TatA